MGKRVRTVTATKSVDIEFPSDFTVEEIAEALKAFDVPGVAKMTGYYEYVGTKSVIYEWEESTGA